MQGIPGWLGSLGPAFGPGHDPRVLGSSPAGTLLLLLPMSLPLCVCVSHEQIKSLLKKKKELGCTLTWVFSLRWPCVCQGDFHVSSGSLLVSRNQPPCRSGSWGPWLLEDREVHTGAEICLLNSDVRIPKLPTPSQVCCRAYRADGVNVMKESGSDNVTKSSWQLKPFHLPREASAGEKYQDCQSLKPHLHLLLPRGFGIKLGLRRLPRQVTFLSLLGLHQACAGEGVGWTLSQGLCVLSCGPLPRFCAPRVDGGRENRVADSTFSGGALYALTL